MNRLVRFDQLNFFLLTITIFGLCLPQAIFGQCFAPFKALDCSGGLHLNLEQAFKQARDRNVSQRGFEHLNETRYNTKMDFIQSDKYATSLDSIFSIAKSHIAEKIGEKNYCERIKLNYEFCSFHLPYRPKLLKGDFVFQFYLEPIKCWTGKSQRIKFSFQEKENGKFDIAYPVHLPDCNSEECNFESLTITEIGEKALELGLIDGTEELRTESIRFGTIAIEKNEIPFQNTYHLFDQKSGAYLKDSIIYARNASANSLQKLVDNSDAVVDATSIGTKEFRAGNGLAYTNHFFQPHYSFKGVNNDKIFSIIKRGGMNENMSHSLYLPGVNERALFFLKKNEARIY